MRPDGSLSEMVNLTRARDGVRIEPAEKSWRRLDAHNQLPKVILGVEFVDEIEVIRPQAEAAA